MISTAAAIAVALTFVWLGMVLAIEAVLAAVITGAVLAMDATTAVAACAAVAVALLAAQLGLVRPRLNRRASQVLAAESGRAGPGRLLSS